ncbi:MAG: two-component regulator propeller domain-containing protein [Bacteroidales bacterium]|nr:two-component regulator propeller domain-containing protein [Bacteroidales bacterium]
MNTKWVIEKVRMFPVLLLLFTGGMDIHAQNQRDFINISVNEGLSQSTIFSIHQDANGFMWFGTRGGGLNRYNGYEFSVFMHQPEVNTSIGDNTVPTVFEDSHGTFWVGTTRGGINRFDLNTGRFYSYHLELNSDIIHDQSLAVRCIFEDHSGDIWIGTNEMVYLFNREADQFDPVLHDAPFPVKGTTGICEDQEGYMYFSTWDRLIRYHPEEKSFAQLIFPIDPFADMGGRINPLFLDSQNRLWMGAPGGLRMVEIDQGFSFSNAVLDQIDWPEAFTYVRTIKETRDGVLWFGTQNGLYAYDFQDSVLRAYRTEPDNPASLVHNSVYSLYEDNVGTLWVGTWSGLSILDKRKYNFNHYAHQYNDPQSLSNNVVSSFQEDTDGTWIGTEQGGLNFLNGERTAFKVYKHDNDDPESLSGNNVKSVFMDSNKDLWVGTFSSGLNLHLGNGKFRQFLEGHSIYSITEAPGGKLFFGGRTGLFVMDLETRNISREVFPAATGMRHFESFVSVLYTDSKNRIWIGTSGSGMYLFDPVRSMLRQFRSSNTDTTSISGDYIMTICEDQQQKVWIGTHSGLSRFNDENFAFDRMNHRMDFNDYTINGLETDDEGRLWISTNDGIYSYDIPLNELRHFDYLDGLQSNEFNRGASYKNSKGELFFGGVYGFNVFHPNEINRNPDAPPVLITDLKLFNKSVVPGAKNSPLEKHILETDKIVLNHRQSSFSFEFVALNYLIPEKNAYKYILEGYENTWNFSGRNRTATYMNLDPGTYTFRVTASNNDNVWNETGASIGVRVKAPYYATPVAMFIYFIVLSVLLFALIRIVRFRAEKENELMLERAEKARIKELNVKRLQFFTNISHEFRTPLTLIAGPLDKLISGKYAHQTDYLLQLMKSNVNRMLRQVNQLMDFRKIENDKMLLRAQKKSLDKFLSQIVLGFEDMASTKMIELQYISAGNLSEEREQWFDVGIMDKVVYNLLSNALKFTPEQGIIKVILTLEDNTARIEVQDTGMGIEQEKINRIFERFYSESTDNVSTGIGLSLSKKLIELHKGNIEVESEKDKGSRFIVTIPVSRESFREDEISASENLFFPERPELDTLPAAVPLAELYNGTELNNQLILIVEDNPEMSSYLANHFSSYKLLMAENGKAAFQLAKESIPDIIISDIMMPDMNGIDLCRAVKKEFLTSHIPVILLSAKAAIDEKIEGMEAAGADAYVEKPFDPEYLSVLVRNLLSQRRKLIEKFSGLGASSSRHGEMENENQVFLQRINQIVQDNIAESSFSVDQLLVEIGMSRSQLYRKFKAISDKNPSEYIRILRLQYACDLLQVKDHTISEIAYMSGFENISYFNTCFKRHFGVSPGKFKAEKA